MCGRFYVDESMEKEIWKIVREVEERLRVPKTGEIRPTDPSLIIRGMEKQKLSTEVMSWGFRSYTGTGLIINARSETVIDKPMFRDSIMQRRCAVPANWFYEWNSQKEIVTFKRADNSTLYMAGIYQRYEDGNRFVIITTGANESMRPVHDRMPVILEEHELETWMYDDTFMSHVLQRVPIQLKREQEFEQQSFVF